MSLSLACGLAEQEQGAVYGRPCPIVPLPQTMAEFKIKFTSEKDMKKVKRPKLTAALSDMPRLNHSCDCCQEFNVMHSEAIAWMQRQPDIMEALWNLALGAGVMIYDEEDGTWRGRETP